MPLLTFSLVSASRPYLLCLAFHWFNCRSYLLARATRAKYALHIINSNRSSHLHGWLYIPKLDSHLHFNFITKSSSLLRADPPPTVQTKTLLRDLFICQIMGYQASNLSTPCFSKLICIIICQNYFDKYNNISYYVTI